MKVNLPFPFSVHHVTKELFIIQQAIFVFVIRINKTLKGNKLTNMSSLDFTPKLHLSNPFYLHLSIGGEDPMFSHLILQFCYGDEPIIVLVQFGK